MAHFLEQKVEEGAFDAVPVAQGGRGLIGKGRGIVFTAGNAVRYCCRLDLFLPRIERYGCFRTLSPVWSGLSV